MSSNSTDMVVGLNDYMTSQASFMTSQASDDVPNNYLSQDQTLQNHIEFKAAVWLDLIFVPFCAGKFPSIY